MTYGDANRILEDVDEGEITLICCCTTGFHNCMGDKLTVKGAIHSPLHALGTGTEFSSKAGCLHFSSAFVVHETVPKVNRYLKGY